MRAEPFLSGLYFGEGVRWHDGRFWFSDFHSHHVASVGTGGDMRVELKIDDQPSGLGWLPDGRLLVVAMKSQQLLRRERDGKVSVHADLKPFAIGDANDMLVDAYGNAFIGCFGFDLEAFIEKNGARALWTGDGPPKAPIMHVSPEGKARIASPDHKFPNGMAMVGDTLIIAECFIPGFSAFTVARDGTLSGRRVWGALQKDPPAVVPDGICVDSEGAVWAANAVGPEVVRIGEGGKILERIETSQNAFSCALGGKDGRQLVIATAPASGSGAAKAAKGMLEIATVKVPA